MELSISSATASSILSKWECAILTRLQCGGKFNSADFSRFNLVSVQKARTGEGTLDTYGEQHLFSKLEHIKYSLPPVRGEYRPGTTEADLWSVQLDWMKRAVATMPCEILILPALVLPTRAWD